MPERIRLPTRVPRSPASPAFHRSTLRRNKASNTKSNPKPTRTVPRCASEPVLWTVSFVSRDDHSSSSVSSAGSSGFSSESMLLPRPQTWTDALSSGFLRSPTRSPRSSICSSIEEAKVVVSVSVEGSPGPVQAMMPLSTTVREAIGMIVDKYSREGRSPKLDLMGSFQLHHSHFTLESLNKSDKIGEVGGRSFYLRKTSGITDFSIGNEECDASAEGRVLEVMNSSTPAILPVQLVFSFLEKRFKKLERRTKKLWKVVICIACG